MAKKITIFDDREQEATLAELAKKARERAAKKGTPKKKTTKPPKKATKKKK